jgi:hypothetical protein
MTATMLRSTYGRGCRRHMSFGDIELGVVCRARPRIPCSDARGRRRRQLPRQGDWDVKLRKLPELGPRWVRAAAGEHGHRRSQWSLGSTP